MTRRPVRCLRVICAQLVEPPAVSVAPAASLASSAAGGGSGKNLFLLAGQSNMAGADAEFVGPLPASEADSATLLATARLVDSYGETRRHDPWGPVRGQPLESEARFVAGANMRIGPEVGFARQLHADGWRDVALLKVSGNFDGAGLPAGAPWPWAERGAMFDQWMQFVDARLDELRSNGKEAVVRGVVWFQGIDDALTGPDFAQAYGANLSGLILTLRRRFRCPNAVFVPARSVNSAFALGKGGAGVDAPMTVVRRAQVAVANALGCGDAVGERRLVDGSRPWVDVDDLPNVNTHHFSMESQLEIGRRLGVVMGRQLLECTK